MVSLLNRLFQETHITLSHDLASHWPIWTLEIVPNLKVAPLALQRQNNNRHCQNNVNKLVYISAAINRRVCLMHSIRSSHYYRKVKKPRVT